MQRGKSKYRQNPPSPIELQWTLLLVFTNQLGGYNGISTGKLTIISHPI